MNIAIEIGRLTKDVELRRTGNGTAVATFTLAVNRPFETNGEKQADFIPCVVWGKLAENTERYCHKGSQVAVDGMLQSRSYEDNNKKKHFVLELVCSKVQFLDTRNNTQPQQNNDQYGYAVGYDPMQDVQRDFDNSMDTFDIMDDDIQF